MFPSYLFMSKSQALEVLTIVIYSNLMIYNIKG
ncbi:hypothetical protein PsalMR5_04524 (plasmid) [Piscirickettsia salmonis]|nr:hypothetical protein PsalSR1_04486 [Piscirickettsia salmonis]QGP66599.1 hypothetical protein PsalMR5_04524 [Piscirickettsia salmonis]